MWGCGDAVWCDVMCCNVQWTDSTVSAAVPAFLERDETQEASLTNLIGVFKEQTMKIFNAVLCQRRVLFLGYQLPAGEVCSHVVGACLLVSEEDRMRRRVAVIKPITHHTQKVMSGRNQCSHHSLAEMKT